jgi:multiple sugar transport system permease protein
MYRRTQVVTKGIAVYAILLGWTAWIGIPLYWLLIFTVKTPLAISAGATYLPFVDFTPTVKAYVDVLSTAQDAGAAFKNSLIISVGSAGIALLIGAMAGYGLARFRYQVGPISNIRLAFFFLVQRLAPLAVLAVPLLVVFRTYHLHDTQIGMILAEIGVGTPFVAWIVRDFFATLPREIEESAWIDGCSRLGVLRHIAFPLGAPGLVAAFILIFVASWNDYFLALMLTVGDSITLPFFIQLQVVYLRDVTNWAYVAVIVLGAMLPPVLVGLAVQRYLIRGLTFGAVKN